MKETGILNRDLSSILADQGHGDRLMVVDAGFAIPKGVKVLDLSLKANFPTVCDVITELKEHFSVEGVIMSKETKKVNPSFYKSILKVFEMDNKAKLLDHTELTAMASDVKAVIRTGDFTAYGNVILISGVGNRWYFETEIE